MLLRRRSCSKVGPAAWSLLPLLLAVGGAVGCFHAPPLPIDEGWVVQQVSSRYREFFPTAPASQHQPLPQVQAQSEDEDSVGLLRPRFGLPEIVQAGTSFSLELLEHSTGSLPTVALLRPEVTTAEADACLRGVSVPGCHRLQSEPVERTPAPGASGGLSVARYLVRLDSPLLPPPGGYDLLVQGQGPGSGAGAAGDDPPTRAPRAVWLRADDPATVRQVRVAHLSDLHVGKGLGNKAALIQAHLKQVVADVNRQAPDLVIVTGDIVNSGQRPQLWPIAQELLGGIASPVLVVLGNHDIEFMARGMRPVRRYGEGWTNFSRAFHPFLHFSLSLGGYDFVGFDSGPAERTPRILTRGLHPSSVALLRGDILRAAERGQRGVVLFSHAPSRAATFTGVAPRSSGFFGRMRYGNTAFERLLVEAAGRGQRVLHLAGHTHWSDVFELDQPSRQFRRWPLEALSPCPRPLLSPVALITTQAAGHSGLFSKANARGYGYSLITLGGSHPELEVFRYGTNASTQCERNLARRLADTSVGSKLL